jgi:N-sulfoglucosamine sulfohydrolase
MDEQMGRVLTAVRELGLDQNTLVIFTTDHGIAMPRAKCSVYEPGLRTSFILRYPSRDGWHGGIRHKHMISNIDCLPTILDLAGVPIPAAVQGRSVAPLMNGRAYTSRDRIFGEITYHDYYDPRRSIRTEGHKLIVNFSSAPAFMDPSQS